MPRVSRRGLNFDLNASQYGVHNSVPTISFAFTRQMNHARARKIVEFTFLTTEHVRPRCASWICFAVGERASERNRNDRFSVLRRALRFARDRFNPSKDLICGALRSSLTCYQLLKVCFFLKLKFRSIYLGKFSCETQLLYTYFSFSFLCILNIFLSKGKWKGIFTKLFDH